MFIKMLLQMSSVFLKIGYVIAMIWLYASKPALIGVGVVIVMLLSALAVGAKIRR